VIPALAFLALLGPGALAPDAQARPMRSQTLLEAWSDDGREALITTRVEGAPEASSVTARVVSSDPDQTATFQVSAAGLDPAARLARCQAELERLRSRLSGFKAITISTASCASEGYPYLDRPWLRAWFGPGGHSESRPRRDGRFVQVPTGYLGHEKLDLLTDGVLRGELRAEVSPSSLLVLIFLDSGASSTLYGAWRRGAVTEPFQPLAIPRG
jgi:hypothetical protein